jgi:hypothetical protein
MVLGLGLCVDRTGALMTTIMRQECVHEEVEYDGDLVSGSFVVIDHGLAWSDEPGVELVVTSPSGTKVTSIFANEGQKFEFQAHQRGLYKFCFNNPAPTPETISFHIHVGHIPGIEDLAKDEHLKPVNVMIAKLREALAAVSEEQIYLKARDLRHRTTNESTNRRLITYTVGEYVCLVGVSLGQVYLIRKLFDKRLGYNRV